MGDVYWGVHTPLAAAVSNLGVKRAIETGTFYGVGSLTLSAIFECVVSIEREEKLSEFCKEVYRSTPVEFRCGSSPVVLRNILEEDPSPTFFFLDAHWFPAPVLHESDSLEQCPVLEEIAVISQFTSARDGSVIVIDDADMFLGSLPQQFIGSQFPSISMLLRILSEKFGAEVVEVIDDVIVAGDLRLGGVLNRYKELKTKYGAPSSKRLNF